MIQYSDIVRIDERMTIRAKGSYSPRTELTFAPGSKGVVKLIRNLVDDTFDIEIPIEVTKSTIMAPITPYVSINNSTILEGSELADRTRSIDPTNKTFKVYHGMLHNFKFRNIRELYVGTMVGNSPVAIHMLKFDFKELPNHIDMKKGQAAEVSAIQSMEFSFREDLSSNARTTAGHKISVGIKLIKSKIIYDPTDRDRSDVVTDVAKIYAKTDEDFHPLTPYLPDVRSDIKSTGVSSGLSTTLERHPGNETVDVENSRHETEQFKYLYDSVIDSSTYYDYDKMKTIVGYSSDSKQGEFIPFGFNGTYSWIHKLKLWDFIKNFEFRYREDYDHSLLNPFDGDIVLNVENSVETPLETTMTISLDDIETIKTAETISLRGLLRISNEKGS